MSELINRWFSRAAQFKGVSACGLRYPDGAVFSRSWDAQFPEAMLNELWPRLVPIAGTTGCAGAERLDWTFDAGMITATTHPGGATFFLLFNSQAGGPDAAGMERMLLEFRTLRG